MSDKKPIKIALIGNPNTGKTSLFNQLTGLNQKVGNYPGITVDKKQGTCKLSSTQTAIIIDLPGTYSINPTSIDESIVLKTILTPETEDYPDLIIVVADIVNLKRNLFLFSQIKDLETPTILVINMADQAEKRGIKINIEALQKELDSPIVLVSARKNQGIGKLKTTITKTYNTQKDSPMCAIKQKINGKYFEKLKAIAPQYSLYRLWLMTTQSKFPDNISQNLKRKILAYKQATPEIKNYQNKETIYRHLAINKSLKNTYHIDKSKATDIRSRLDKIFTHKIFGYVLFLGILFLIFQSVFDLASAPMDFIDLSFAKLASFSKQQLPAGMFTNLLTEGIIPGVGGVLIFIPQIAILFLFIAILEETGYMSRVVFLMDKVMRKFGMSGKSVVPLISGTACAIPAIMATRTISSWKERLITILVTPFTTCSARLPVYAILIALIIPNTKLFGFIGLQGLTLLALYILGFSSAILAAYILNKTLKTKNKSLFVIEMPSYKLPSLKNVFLEVLEKTKAFIFDAGKIILAISVILWFLASNGPQSYQNIEQNFIPKKGLSAKENQHLIASLKIEKSYIGIMGKIIEPLVKPLGYDWKIGIALISSFAAREVFVGTLATIYSVEYDGEDISTIKQKMATEINPNTGQKRFDLATGMSLLIFYAFAMQCIATLAIVKRETKSWKWALMQLFGMSSLAYLSAFITYQTLS